MTKTSNFLLLLFFTFFAISVTAPLASSHYVPSGDFMDHAKAIVLAKNALAENQFPIRVAPDLNDGPRYPLFQFYSPVPYMITGFFYKFISVKNPYVVYKLFTWISIILGGLFIYRTCNFLIRNQKIAILAGLAYQFSPYWIINTTVRTDFTESVAQGLLPVALYYSIRVFQQYDIKRFILASIMWAILAMTHLITFAYALAFFCILIGMWTLSEKIYRRGFVNVIGMIIFSYLLAAWFLGPIIQVHQLLNMQFGDPTAYNWLTPLAGLLSLQSTSPIPLPANGELGVDYLYPAIGYPVLLGIGILIYAFVTDKEFYLQNKILRPLFITFFLAFLATWTPLNIWKYFPNILVFFQFSYRFLAQVNWIGVLLFAYAMKWLFKKEMNHPSFIAFMCIIVIGNSFWIHSQKNNDISAHEITRGYKEHNADGYQINPAKIDSKDLLAHSKMVSTCKQNKLDTECLITVSKKSEVIALPMLWYPKLINLTIDNSKSAYYPTIHNKQVLVGLELQAGQHTVKANFTGALWANWTSLVAWSVAIILLIHARYRKFL